MEALITFLSITTEMNDYDRTFPQYPKNTILLIAEGCFNKEEKEPKIKAKYIPLISYASRSSLYLVKFPLIVSIQFCYS